MHVDISSEETGQQVESGLTGHDFFSLLVHATEVVATAVADQLSMRDQDLLSDPPSAELTALEEVIEAPDADREHPGCGLAVVEEARSVSCI